MRSPSTTRWACSSPASADGVQPSIARVPGRPLRGDSKLHHQLPWDWRRTQARLLDLMTDELGSPGVS